MRGSATRPRREGSGALWTGRLGKSSSASGPAAAKRGPGSSRDVDVSRVGDAGDAQAAIHTSNASVHARGRARPFASVRIMALDGVGGPLHVGEVAQEEPGRERADEVAGALHPQAAVPYRLRERESSRPHAGHGPRVGRDHEVDLEPGILEADVRSAALEDQPAGSEGPAAGREGAKVEADDG